MSVHSGDTRGKRRPVPRRLSLAAKIVPAGIRRRVATVLIAAVLGAIVPSVLLIRGVVGAIDDEISESRLQLSQLMAAQGDRLLTEAFFEIDIMATGFARGPDGEFLTLDTSEARVHFGRSAVFNAGVVFLDGEGDVLFAEPNHTFDAALDGDALLTLAAAAESTDRTVSLPYLSSATGHVVAALSLPVFGSDGARIGTVVGIVDLTDPFITDLIQPARRLGNTGHADLVDERGLVLASTDPSHVLTPGDHPEFYVEMAQLQLATLRKVAHSPDPGDVDQSAVHVMAYAPLREAPWGVVMGASEADTFVRADRLRRRLIIFGLASVATVFMGIWLAVRIIPQMQGRRAGC